MRGKSQCFLLTEADKSSFSYSLHVRRTDKVGTEAAFHPIEEYMVHVEEQFQYMAQRGHVDKKRVYLATDDPSLLQEAKTK